MVSNLLSNGESYSTSSYSEDIIGEWEPIEEAEYQISFSKYGVMTQEISSLIKLNLEYPYSINGDVVTITQKKDNNEKEQIDFRVVINAKEDGTYLEIYGVTQLSGLYRKKEQNSASPTPAAELPTTKEASQPTKKPSAANQPVTTTKQKEEKQASLTKILPEKQPSLPNSQPASNAVQTLSAVNEIVGKWQPVEGAENPLEFTKYGTVIQTMYGDLQMRSDYSINGENIKLRYDKATFKIIKEGGNTYLEIYNSNDFSGRYRRKSQPTKINATIIDKNEYSTYIVGKWTPITGQENPIEFTKFNTAIQTLYGDLDMRSDYSLKADNLTIHYDKNARVVISEDSNNYYLEIFNTTDFSGRYKKSK